MRNLSSLRAAVALAVIAPVGFLAANAVSSTGGRLADPLNATTFTDPTLDNEARAPDIAGGTLESFTDGLLRFTVSLPRQVTITRGDGFGIFIDSDRNRATGDAGAEYILAVDGKNGLPPAIEVYAWSGIVWNRVPSAGLSGRFDSSVGVVLEINRADLGNIAAFNWIVRTSWVGAAGVLYHDFAPTPPEFFTFQVAPAATTTATTTTTPTTTTKPPPAAVQKLTGRVGPGAKITFVRSAKAGKAAITIDDLTAKDSFHLTGPGVNRRTGVAFKGVARWAVTLRAGTYRFRSDAHASLHGTLKVSPAT